MEHTEITKLSFNDIKSQFGINLDEHFDTHIVIKGKSPVDKPVLSKMTVILEVFV